MNFDIYIITHMVFIIFHWSICHATYHEGDNNEPEERFIFGL